MTTHWMDMVMQAEREGRVPAGAGPLYTRRILPAVVPVSRQNLLEDGVSRATIRASFLPVTRSLYLPRPDADVPSRHGIRGLDRVYPTGRADDPGHFVHDIVSRARAHWMQNPTAMVGGWAALAFHGLPYWADTAPVLLHSPRSSPCGPGRTVAAARTPHRPVVRAWPAGIEPVYPDPLMPGLAVIPPETAAAQCLASVLRSAHTWFVAGVNGVTVPEVRAVQLIDALRQCTVTDPEALIAGCARRVDRRVVRRLVELSDSGAQSPQETLLRLVVRDLLPDGHRWESQVPVSWGERAKDRTVLDLACRRLRVGLYYDGASHAGEGQKLKDFVQFQELKDMGWEVVRADSALLHRERGRFLQQVGNAVDRAGRSLSLPGSA